MPYPFRSYSQRFFQTACLSAAILVGGCGDNGYEAEEGADAQGHTAPTGVTIEANAAVLEQLNFSDRADYEAATRGLIASADSLIVRRADSGEVVWNQDQYSFVREGEAPDSVNPSLWRQSQLNAIHGLFEVTPGIYQLRGFDLANMTLIKGDTGWIIVDPLTSAETAKAAWDFAMKHLPKLPVSAVLFTHSHVDHFGGVLGIISEQEVAERNVPVIAPHGFAEESVSENVMAGLAMQRRAEYQYGMHLSRSDRGHVGLGLGLEVPFGGHIGYMKPTIELDGEQDEMTVDGVKMVFQYAPNSEAPAEFVFWLPELKAFCGAEVVSRTMHNVYTLRGAKVRDSLGWSKHIDKIASRMGGSDVYFGSHHWPIWGESDIVDFLEKQRDTYKFIHDQALRLANAGFTPREIAEQLTLPEELASEFYNRGYYGTLKHNVKAVYQFYFGWYDANPANLDPLPPVEGANKYVEALGGIERVLELSQQAYDNGEYRWAAELLNHGVFSQPSNKEARSLLAAVFDQLGYQAESGPWRDVYLSAATELRHGVSNKGSDLADAVGMLRAIPVDQFFDSMASRLNPEKAEGVQRSLNIVFTDLEMGAHTWVNRSVMHHQPYDDQDADATLYLTHELFLKIVTGTAGIKDTILSDDMRVEGSSIAAIRFLTMLDRPDGRFEIIAP